MNLPSSFSKLNGFLIGLAGVFALAALAPGWGGPNSPLPVSLLRRIGVFLVFFNQGVLLAPEVLRRGLREWRLHVLVQAAVFGLFPALTFAFLWMFRGWVPLEDLRLGFWFLALLPTTITSAVALTSVAEGNVSGALFNCTLSSVIGVFWVPTACVLFLGAGGVEGAASPLPTLLATIGLTLLAPLVLGQLLRFKLREVFAARKSVVRRFNQGVILFIVWGAFCEGFLRRVWSRVSTADLAGTAGGALGLLVLMSLLVWCMSRGLRLELGSRATALFCGSQKTLALGLPMATLIFGATPGVELSLVLLPLLIYHPLQLVAHGLLATKVRLPPESVR